MSKGFLEPKTSAPDLMRKKKNGQFRNPPAYAEGMGGFTSSSKLVGDPGKNMRLEGGGPSSKKGKPI